MVDMKQDQLIKTVEALVECQTNNVKSLYKLAQVIRERMNKEAEVEALTKLLDNCQAMVEEKDRELQTLRVQPLPQDDTVWKTLRSCRQELELAKEENCQLREKLQLQQKEFEL